MEKGEIILFQPQNESITIDVLVDNETVWLTQAQIMQLFGSSKQSISKHINRIYRESELERESTVNFLLTVQKEGDREVQRKTAYYNLDMIISVGYRVKSQRGIEFRIWANKVLREYILRGHAVSQRFERLEHRVTETERMIGLVVNSSITPKEGVFFDGEIFDAYTFVSDLIKSAKDGIVLLDNYIDETVLLLLAKRQRSVSAEVYTKHISQTLQLDLAKHNAQYDPIIIQVSKAFHDRFLIIDDVVYHFGASLKDLGKKLFAFSQMEIQKTEIMKSL